MSLSQGRGQPALEIALQPRLLPVFTRLDGRDVLVVGGGTVAAAKLAALQGTGAVITVVAPMITRAVRKAGCTIRRREVRAADLDGKWLVITAAPPSVNRRVAAAAARRRVFVNAVDDPAHASIYLGGVVRRHGVTIAVSTEGRAPALAGLIREGLDRLLPHDLDRWLTLAERLRRSQRRRGVPMSERRPQLLEAMLRLYEPDTRARQ